MRTLLHAHVLKTLRLAAIFAALIAVVFWSACDSPTNPLPRNAVVLVPPAQYGFWWQMTESCSGLTGDLSALRWYVQPGVEALEIQGDTSANIGGIWFSSGNQILLTEESVNEGSLVRHEMLHALLRSGDHPWLYFHDRCNGIVYCDAPCPSDVPPDTLPPTGVATIDVRDLAVSMQTLPESVSASATGGWLAVVVNATNPRQGPEWVRLAWNPDGFESASATFGYLWAGDSHDYVLTDSIAFRGGETKRLAFDVNNVPVGTFAVRGYFNIDTTPPFPVTVRP